MKTFRIVCFILFAILFCSLLHAETQARILYTNDIHARIVPIESKNHKGTVSGAIRRTNLIDMLKNQGDVALLLDAGDKFQGTPFYSIFKGEANFRIAKAIGYDATTLGNHELDNSLENLLEKLRMSDLRLLCCNVFYRHNNKPAFKPYHVFRRNDLTIAVIGSIGDEAWDVIDVKTKAPLYATKQIEEVRKVAKRLRPYADLVIVLSHAGFDPDCEMAKAISEIDLILGGHSHTELFSPVLIRNSEKPGTGRYNNGLNGTIVAQAGKHGIYLGILDIVFNNRMRIATFSGRLELVDSRYDHPSNNRVSELVNFYQKQLEGQMKQIAGHSNYELDYPSDLKKTHLLPMGTFAAEAMRKAGDADFCLVNSGGIRAGIPAGNITWANIYQALPYDNTVVTFSMTGEQIKKMLALLCQDREEFDGFQYSGLSGKLNILKQCPENLKIQGEPVKADKIYRVSTSSFVANGNLGGNILFSDVESIEDSGIFMCDAAIQYLAKVRECPDFSENDLEILRQ
jgi:2',3'-cyclic-nucleotide 2'-phosphodiesterase (5'-nucleotidase family)